MAKIRNGFVSNSSSSSFVLVKSLLTDAQLDELRAWVGNHNRTACEGYIHETKSAFFGEKDYHMEQSKAIDEVFALAEFD